MAEKMFGHPTAGIFGYSHLTGGYAGGQAEYARVPYADVGPIKIEDDLPDEQVLFLSDIFPTGYMGAEFCDIKGGEVIAVFGAGPVGQFAIASAVMLGAERVIAIDQYDYRLADGASTRRARPTSINFAEDADIVEQLKELTGGRGPGRGDRRRRHGGVRTATAPCTPSTASSRPTRMRERPRPRAARRDPRLPAGRHRLGHRRLRRADGQVPDRRVHEQGPDHQDRPVPRAALPASRCTSASSNGDIDPSFVVTHRLPLGEAPDGYETFKHKQDECVKVVLKP